ncbi:hypothetical protein [Thiococcus pfennigii]|uniref:hypothetical protein n=1 Tax=Thiococcus pfennigii TaxID=1057 RepID=UPI00190739D5|nr:hypothetical protein [Thiococcus pfennigii]
MRHPDWSPGARALHSEGFRSRVGRLVLIERSVSVSADEVKVAVVESSLAAMEEVVVAFETAIG